MKLHKRECFLIMILLTTLGCSSYCVTYSCSNRPLTIVAEELTKQCRENGIDYEFKTGIMMGNWLSGTPADFGMYEAFPGDLERYPANQPVGIPLISVRLIDTPVEQAAQLIADQHPSILRVTLYDETLAIFHPTGCWNIPTRKDNQSKVTAWSQEVHRVYRHLRYNERTSLESVDMFTREFEVITRADVRDLMMKNPEFMTKNTQQEYAYVLKNFVQMPHVKLDDFHKLRIRDALSSRENILEVFGDDSRLDKSRLEKELEALQAYYNTLE